MANIGTVLKFEITRLARREMRREVQPLRKMAAGYRRDIAALKRAVTLLERRAKALSRSEPKQRDPALPAGKSVRFVAKGLISLRKRLGVSAVDLARLLGVSMQSVYNWEHKKATPRKEQVNAIVALRSLGKKEAHARLEGLKASAKNKTTRNARSERKNQSKKA
jgi:DNA-binding transcriptional regulator YiaG